MRTAAAAGVVLVLAACGGGRVRGTAPPGVGGGGAAPDTGAADDRDGDGWSVAQGDCDDTTPLVGPGAMEVPGNGVDDDCDGRVDEVDPGCDGSLTGKLDARSLSRAIDQCDDRFVRSASFRGPSLAVARRILPAFGVLSPRAGASMVLLSTGKAVDKKGPGFVSPQTGTDLGASNTFANPDPNLAVSGCSQTQPSQVNDYTEWVLTLKAPTNAYSFSFDFQFFSAEYPEFVCTAYNDEFLVEMESTYELATPANISFDEQQNPITVNNGFFTVCKSATTAQTMHCKRPVSDIAGSGFEDLDGDEPVGGATGWLTTTAPVTPGEELTLRFIIFDEGDHIYDSAVLVDHFQWSVNAVEGPTTIQ